MAKSHTHTYTHIRQSLTHTHTHTHTHGKANNTHKHTRARAHTHTHTGLPFRSIFGPLAPPVGSVPPVAAPGAGSCGRSRGPSTRLVCCDNGSSDQKRMQLNVTPDVL